MLKFGGTSVSSLANWRNIAKVVAERRAGGARVLIVHSAITGVTDHLETAEEDVPGIRGQATWFTVTAPVAILTGKPLPRMPDPPPRPPTSRWRRLVRPPAPRTAKQA